MSLHPGDDWLSLSSRTSTVLPFNTHCWQSTSAMDYVSVKCNESECYGYYAACCWISVEAGVFASECYPFGGLLIRIWIPSFLVELD